MVDGQTILTRDLLSVYHEILINEIALMRSNVIVEEGVNSGDAIIYVTDFMHNPDTSRGLDYVLLAYSIINGLRRLECGYNILSPADPVGVDEVCRNKIMKKMKELIGIDTKNIADGSIERLLAKLVLKLLDSGLVNIVLDDNSDAISPLLTHYKVVKAGDFYSITNMKELCELRIYQKLMNFFKTFRIDIDKLIEEFKKIFEEEINVKVNLGLRAERKDEVKISELKFKTLHGMLFDYVAHAGALPLHPAVLEANVLPFLIEPLPFPSEEGGSLSKQFEELLRLTDPLINKEVLQILIKALEDVMGRRPLSNYQYKYVQDIIGKFVHRKSSGKNYGILVALTSPTGTGKTYVFLFHVLLKLLEARFSSPKRRPRALLLYPRKALARDQLDKILALVNAINRELSKKNIERIKVGILDHDSLWKEGKRGKLTTRELRGLKLNGKKLYHCFDDGKYEVFLGEPETYEAKTCEHVQRQVIDWIKDAHYMSLPDVFEDIDILVTNHSMLTKLLFENFVYSRNSSFIKFVKDVEVLVLDEAHIYLDDEELEVIAPTLLKLFFLRSKLKGSPPRKVEELAKELDLDVIISSATLTDSSIIVKGDFKLDSRSIVGFFKVKLDDQEVGMPEPLKNFLQALISRIIYNEFEARKAIVYHDYDVLLSKNVTKDKGLWRGPLKVRVSMVAHPYPRKESWTSLAEAMIAVLHWVNAIRARKLSKDVQALVFIDMKETLKDIFKTFLRRQILEAQDHADRVLLTGKYRVSLIDGGRERSMAMSAIANYIDESIKQGKIRAIADVIYRDRLLKHFHVLHPYITLKDFKVIMSNYIKSYDDLLNNLLDKMSLSNKKVKMIDSLNGFACHVLEIMESSKKTYGKLLKEVSSYSREDEAVIFLHHGDLEPEERSIIEACMTGDKRPIPLLVMATKTLEVGVDIKGLSLIIQYSSHPYSVELAQRFGRSGRSESSFLVSTLILILRNSGEDVRYLLDQEAVEYVYNLEIPRVRNVLEEEDVVVRSITKPLLAEEGAERMRTKQELEDFLSMLEESFGLKFKSVLRKWASEAFKLPVSAGSQISIKETVKGVLNVLRNIMDDLMEIGRDDVISEIDAVKKELEAIKYWERFAVNLMPLIAKLSALRQKLMEVQGQVVNEIGKERIMRAQENVCDLICELANYMIDKLKEIISIKEARNLVTLHVPPGVTNDIGKIELDHFIYSLSSEGKRDIRKVSKKEASEAFERIRPLHTGG
jgi:hypothetical protein